MNRFTRRRVVSSGAAVAAFSVTTPMHAQPTTPAATPLATPVASGFQVRLLDNFIVPNDLMVGDTLVGGISGIDYDAANDIWYLISDDRSGPYPPRFYTGSIAYDDNGFTDVSIQNMVALLQEDGSVFPNWDEGRLVPDPESIRKDPNGDQLWWTSEGAYDLDLNPFVAISNPDGTLENMITLPAPFATEYPEEPGPRDNHNFEGLTFSPDGETLWIGMEHPLYQDGSIPSPDTNAYVRLINIDRAGTILREYAVELDPIDAPEDAQYYSTGMSEILMLDDNRILSVARTTVADGEGAFENYIRLWELDLTDATDIHGMESLAGAEFTPVTRRLVIDLNDAGLYPIDNIEGIAFGPNLPNGNRALVLANDNNFDFETQVAQFVLLEVTGE